MPQVLDWIPSDGYTEEAYVAEQPRIHGPFRFKYRPTLPEEREAVLEANRKLSSVEYYKTCVSVAVGARPIKVCGVTIGGQRLVEWSLADEHGKPVPITVANVMRLKPELWQRVREIILGLAASDVDPAWPVEKQVEQVVEGLGDAVSADAASATDAKN